MRKRIIAFVSVIMCAMMFAGCKNTLEKKVSKKELKEMNDQAYEQYVKNDDSIKDIKIEIKGNEVIYKYYFNMELSEDQIALMQKNVESASNKKMVENIRDGLADAYKLKDVTVTYIYYDINDEEIARLSV
ncbi:MAG: hypothetical protein J6Y58_04365 [Clostridiales bacterium]|nr:hypothetical protein [Clostridiales bacterium]